MSSKFHIDFTERNDNLHIQLEGNLDGSSASELANFIDGIRSRKGNLLIDTSKLEKVFHFGTCVLRSRLLAGRFPLERIAFAGEMAGKIAPRGCRIFQEGLMGGCGCDGDCTNCTCGKAREQSSNNGKPKVQ